jgi:hypothetical protein
VLLALVAEGPHLWGLLIPLFAAVVPMLTRLSGQGPNFNRQLFATFLYIWLVLHAIVVLRYYELTVPSELVDHGLTASSQCVINLVAFNLGMAVAWVGSGGIVDVKTIQAQNQLFATISHDMRQPY